MKNHRRIWLSLLIGTVLIGLWLCLVDIEAVTVYSKKVNLRWFSLACLFYFFAYFIRSLRWRAILKPLVKMSISNSYLLCLASNFINYIIPLRLGEVGKSIFLKNKWGLPKSRTLPTVILDKAMDLFPVVPLLCFIPFACLNFKSAVLPILFFVLIALLVSIGLLVFSLKRPESMIKTLSTCFAWLPYGTRNRLMAFFDPLVRGMKIFERKPLKLIEIFFWTILAVLADAVYFMFMFYSFDYFAAFLVVLIGYTIINLSCFLPTPPAQIGSNELLFIMVFSLGLGIEGNLVASTEIFAHIVIGTLIATSGIAAATFLGFRIGETFSELSVDNPKS